MSKNGQSDLDPQETEEWLEALQTVVACEGAPRARFLLDTLEQRARQLGCAAASVRHTAYCNTIPTALEPAYPGDVEIEARLRALVRWNAMAVVVRGQRTDPDLGGHIGSFASSATLYDVGFNHFWRAPTKGHGGDLIYIQGHSSPGIYARSFLEGVLPEEKLVHFRREAKGQGLSSYPHPWLMPDYWQFPTVSMGLGPIQAIFQARFMKYLQARGFDMSSDRKVWCFCGDGEMDEPESLGAIGVAAREKLDNLVFVINCNLQRLDGPVRGNGKIIQELEAAFSSVGWNVLKVIWGSSWDPLLEADHDGLLLRRMEEAVDGDYQNYKAKGAAYVREHFFGHYPELKARVAHMSDADIFRLTRGGHDTQKLYAAYANAMATKGKPTVILAKTVKGYGLGEAGEAMNTAHNTKKLNAQALRAFRDRFDIPVSDKVIDEVPFYRPSDNSPEIQYLKDRRAALGGQLPQRRRAASKKVSIPALESFAALLEGSGDRKISTTMAFVRILGQLAKDKGIGKCLVPIVPDEARTFGMEGLFRQIGIYAPEGQKYEPVDKDQVMFYKEAQNGQILQEGLNEAGAFCSWIASATSYSNHDQITIPFYIYYSMFGFQRIGDLAWAAGDIRAKGFLIGGTSGRTTLNGEGLQHEDGHSHILANTIPNCESYDPTFSYELAVIIHHGLERMYTQNEDVYFYITTMNENYAHPKMPKGAEEGIIKGLYLLNQSKAKSPKARAQLLGSGTILNEVIEAAACLEKDFSVACDVWSATSFNALGRDGRAVKRDNHRHPDRKKQKKAYIAECLEKTEGPIIAATDYMQSYTEQVRPYIPEERGYYTLGTDGFGRSDTRAALREHFEVDSNHIAYTTVLALVEEGSLPKTAVKKALKLYAIDSDKPDPLSV